MLEGKITPGKHSLLQLQTQIATDRVSLISPTLEPFHVAHKKTAFFEKVRSLFDINMERSGESHLFVKRRLEAIQHDQSNEPHRAFLELALNSIDYGGDHLKIFASQQKDGGWQVVIGDKPEGVGMSRDVFLNTYLDPYASGSALDNRTPRGEFKRGLMGVGAQQQFGLLRHAEDHLWISSSQNGEVTVARFAPDKKGRIDITIGGTEKADSRSGVQQILQLSSKTCKEIGFSPENLGAYLAERLSLLEGKTIDMVVVGNDGRDKSLTLNSSSETAVMGMKRAWEQVGPRAPLQEGIKGRGKESIVYPISGLDIGRQIFNEGGSEGVNLVVSQTTSEASLVYLNVLGVRFGEPIVIEGKDLPSEIDLLFNHPMQVNEARNTVMYSRDDYKAVTSLLHKVTESTLAHNPVIDAQLKLKVLDALEPFLKQMNVQNRWAVEKGCNVETGLERTYRAVLHHASEEGLGIVPASLAGVLSANNILYANDRYLRGFIGQIDKIEGVTVLDTIANNTYLASLEVDQPIWISPDGTMVIFNQRYFEGEWDITQIVRSKALLLNLHSWGRVSTDVARGAQPSFDNNGETALGKESYEARYKSQRVQAQPGTEVEAVKDTGTSEVRASNYPAQIDRELNDVARLYIEQVRRLWHNPDFTYEQKQEAINRYIKMAYVENPNISGSQDIQITERGGLYNILPKYNGINFTWHQLSEEDLDAFWDTLVVGFDENISPYAPGNAYGSRLFLDLLTFPTFNEDVAYMVQRYMKDAKNDINHQWRHLQFAESRSLLKLYRLHEQKIPVIWDGDDGFEYLNMYNSITSSGWNFLIEHREEFANIAGIQGEARDFFLSTYASIDSLAKFKDEVKSVFGQIETHSTFEADKNTSLLLILFPEQAYTIKQLIDTYEEHVLLPMLMYSIPGINRARGYNSRTDRMISPDKIFHILIPAMQGLGIDITDIQHINNLCAAVCQTTDVIHDPEKNYTQEEILLWEIYHNELPLDYVTESIKVPSSGEIRPAALLLLALKNRWHRARKAVNLAEFVENQRFNVQKTDVRLREELHLINNLDHTAGSSVFELFKNSWQAVAREKLSGERKVISFSDGVSKQGSETIYNMILRDHVGMEPREALHKLLVPGEGEGAHGIHFLSVLKDFDTVQVRTSTGGKIGIITLQAVRNQTGGVSNFRVFFEEEANIKGEQFIGTQIQLQKAVNPSSVELEAGIFRRHIGQFGQNIPLQRAHVMLNGQLLNAESPISFITSSTLGQIEIKATTERNDVLIAVDDMPMPRYPLKKIVERAAIPELAKKVLLSSGFELNIVASSVKTTRDNGSFQEERKVARSIRQVIEQNWPAIIQNLIAQGGLNLDTEIKAGHKLLPDEIWSDRGLTEQMSRQTDIASIDWKHHDELVQWIIFSQPIVVYKGSSYTLGDIVRGFYDNTLSAELYREIPLAIRIKLTEGKNHKSSEPYQQFELPQDVQDIFSALVGQVEQYLFPRDSSHSAMSAYKGELRGMETLAYYDVRTGRYAWSNKLIGLARSAKQGDLNALAQLVETLCHEAEHKRVKSQGALLHHTGAFYEQVQETISNLPLTLAV